jgi:hypothetical protein
MRKNRSVRPELSGLEGRQLLSLVGSPKAIVGSPEVSHAQAATTPPVTTFGDTSNAAPALVEFRGQTLLVFSSSFNGALNVATVAKGPSGFQLKSKVTLNADITPSLTPAATVFDGRLYLAWTGTDGRLNVISSADGVHFANKVTLADTSRTGPALAAFNGRLYLGFTGLDGRLNVESSANGVTFGNKVTLNETSFLVFGKHVVELSPALASFGGRLFISWTGTNTHLNVESSANGVTFGNKVTLGVTSEAAPALTVEQPAVKGQPTRLVLGWTSVGNPTIITLTSTDGRTFGGKVASKQTGFGGLALLSPSAGTLDIAWDGFQAGLRHLNFMQA